jgi:hypothetical protein
LVAGLLQELEHSLFAGLTVHTFSLYIFFDAVHHFFQEVQYTLVGFVTESLLLVNAIENLFALATDVGVDLGIILYAGSTELLDLLLEGRNIRAKGIL